MNINFAKMYANISLSMIGINAMLSAVEMQLAQRNEGQKAD